MRISSVLSVLVLIGFTLISHPASADVPPAPAVSPEPPADPFALYVSSKYGYCDAKVLSTVWGKDTLESKSAIGQLLLRSESALLETKLGEARTRALADMENRDIRCHYSEIGVTYEDAVSLSTFWGIDSWEAKMRVEEKYLRDGHVDTHIREAIRMAGAGG